MQVVDRESVPYVGPRPIGQGELLFGRDREIRDLIDLLVAKRIMLLHSPSGAGKSSLINAGLFPALKKEGFYLLDPMRVNKELSARPDVDRPSDPPNRYVFSALRSLEESWPASERLSPFDLGQMTLAGYIDRRRSLIGDEALVLIFDQFEEVITTDPVDLAAKQVFFGQVGELLRDRRNWALFAMREDYVGNLDPYLPQLPTQLSVRMRLDFLSVEAARAAIQRPVHSASLKDVLAWAATALTQVDPALVRRMRAMLERRADDEQALLDEIASALRLRTFTNEAAQKLADDLRQISTQQPDGSRLLQPGPYIEPVQMQVVCKRLWDNRPKDANQIDADMVEATGSVDEALAGYFGEKVAGIASQLGVQEWRMREWFDQKLITASGIRGQVMRGSGESEGLKNEAIHELIDAYLVREERRRGVTWYELAHDRLVNPIRNDNRAWRSAHLSPFHDQATRWVAQRRSSDLLLTGDQVLELERWEEAHPAQLTDDEQDLLDESLKAKSQRQIQLVQDARRGTNLAQTGWGVVFAHDIGADVRKALEGLLELRRARATEIHRDYYREFAYLGAEGARPAETAQQFLARCGAGIGAMQPETVPHYLLLVGSPATIPFAFQYELDLRYAVGRLYFDTPDEYFNYAQSVVRAEMGERSPARRVALFAPAHPDDPATQMTVQRLVQPLLNQIQSRVGGWRIKALIQEQATKRALLDLLTGDKSPDLLFAVAHGLAFSGEHAEQLSRQGALVCQDWPGPRSWSGAFPPRFYFSGDDLPPEANLQGLIAFLAVDYGAATPANDEYTGVLRHRATRDGQGRAFLARLPQRMLSHPGGAALAVCGHVDRQMMIEANLLDVSLFSEILAQLMNGATVGVAMETINQRYALLAARISEMLRQRMAQNQGAMGGEVDSDLRALMAAMVDARNYIILGDPAVRLRLEGAPASAASAGTLIPVSEAIGVMGEGQQAGMVADDMRSRGQSSITTAYAELEIRLSRVEYASYRCDMRFSRPLDEAIVEWSGMRFEINHAALLASELDPGHYGQQLARMLFVEPVRAAFSQAQAAMAVQNIPLRIYLAIDASAAELQSLAWELMHDPLNLQSPLILREQVLFSRYVLSSDLRPLPKARNRANALVVVANPKNLEHYGLSPLDLDREYSVSRVVLGDIPTTRLELATPDNLSGALRQGYSVLYLVAHSVLASDGRIALFLDGPDGRVVRLTLPDFESIITSLADPPQLVVLGAVQGAATRHSEAQAPLAWQLVRAGVSAVLAVQQAMSLEETRTFMSVFFRELARDHLVDRAVAAARSAIRHHPGWWAPMLFMRMRSGRLLLAAEKSAEAFQAPFMAPVLPGGYVARPALLAAIVEGLTNSPSSLVTALTGIGGSGKTVLAAAVCHDASIRAEFEDGILWARLGPSPDLLRLLTGLVAAATADTPAFVSLEEATTAWRRLAQERAMLVVLDDVWDQSHLGPLLGAGPHCRYLVTSRNSAAIPASSRVISVGSMTQDEALQLLWTDLPPDAHVAGLPLVERLAGLPLSLGLANAALRKRLKSDQDGAGAVDHVMRTLERRGLAGLDRLAGAGPDEAIADLLESTLERLDPKARNLLAELAVFREDTDIPLTLVEVLWARTNDFSAVETKHLLTRLSDLALVAPGLAATTVRLHPLVREFVWIREDGFLAAVHAQLLQACWRHFHLTSWTDLPADQGYLWRNLAYHLGSAGRSADLSGLLFQFGWLQAKLAATDFSALIADYGPSTESPEEVRWVESALRLSERILTKDKAQLAAQLVGRLADSELAPIQTLLGGARHWRGASWLRPLTTCLTAPEKTLPIHQDGPIGSVVFTPDGRWVLSASWSGKLRAWDASTGRFFATLGSHDDRLSRVLVTGDGQLAVSAALDGSLKAWDLSTLSARAPSLQDVKHASFAGHAGPVWAIACASNGRWLASAAWDRTVQVWDLRSAGRNPLVLKGHEDWLSAVAMTSDDRLVISASWDGKILVWDATSGKLLKTMSGHTALINDLAVAPDGRLLLSASDDGTLMAWDPTNGKSLATLSGHAAPVKRVAINPDGTVAVSAGEDGGLNWWKLPAGAPSRRNASAEAVVRDVAWSPHGAFVVSAAEDGAVSVWDSRTHPRRAAFTGEGAMWCGAIAPDGRTVAAGDSLGRVSIFGLELHDG